MAFRICFLALLAFASVVAYPQCGGPNNQDLFGGPDPQTCSGPLDPNGRAATTQQCSFDRFDLVEGTWYQQYASTLSGAAAFQQGQSCIQTTYTPFNNNLNFTVTHQAKNSAGSWITYAGAGGLDAVPNFPGKWTTVYPSNPELFPVLAYQINGQDFACRPQYIVRRADKWMILSDFGCQTLFVLSRDPTPDSSYASAMQSALSSLYFGSSTVQITQGASCNYPTPVAGSGSSSSSSTSSSTTSSSTSSSSTSSSSSSSSSTSSSSSSGQVAAISSTSTTSGAAVPASSTSTTSTGSPRVILTTGSTGEGSTGSTSSTTTGAGVIQISSTSTGAASSPSTSSSTSSTSANSGIGNLQDNTPSSSPRVFACAILVGAMIILLSLF